jgi:DNA-directed RNA polymerase specialized sigma subunit
MAGRSPGDDEVVAALIEQAKSLEARLAEMPSLAAQRRQVVRELKEKVGATEAGRMLGISRQAVYQLIK